MFKFGFGKDKGLTVEPSVVDVSRIITPDSKEIFQSPKLEMLFSVSAADSLSKWYNMTVEKLRKLVDEESITSGKSTEQVKGLLVERMKKVEKGFNEVIKNNTVHIDPGMVTAVVVRLRELLVEL